VDVTLVSLTETESAKSAGRPALTPELLAATGARYSRSNQGLTAILGRIDQSNLDRSVDAIFKMVDYGHQSIADMAPVAMFLDGISIWLAYHVWSLCPTAGGQESSTRYIRLDAGGVIPPDELGIPQPRRDAWSDFVRRSFSAYDRALSIWQTVAQTSPEVVRLPMALVNDSSEKAAKQRGRILRNYAFDRSRYFIPSAAATNVMLIMSARGWVQLCQNLLSHPLLEPQNLGKKIRSELALVVPRLLRHAQRQQNALNGILQEVAVVTRLTSESRPPEDETSGAFVEVMPAPGVSGTDLASGLAFHDNRYAWIGHSLRRTAVRFGWNAVSFAEIRDLNRHRTGSKFCPFVPTGFYAALDQTRGVATSSVLAELESLLDMGREWGNAARQRLAEGELDYVYLTSLGTTFSFEHTTTADKFIYEAELRTGVGAHFRYAKHLRDVLSIWYQRYPETKGLILEGSAEPE
jgi:thymidylate synthase ThyX